MEKGKGNGKVEKQKLGKKGETERNLKRNVKGEVIK